MRNARTMPADATPAIPPRAVRADLPGLWRIVFAVEIPICLGTCLLWLLAPAEYLGGFLGKRPHDVADYLLLQQSTAVVFSMFVYFYGRVLLSHRVDLRTFRYLQEAMALGDGIVLGASWAAHAYLAPRPDVLYAQTAMAALWLGIRILFLIRVPTPVDDTA
ncbi:MAG: hypothetical protein JWP48_1093 [Actinoallomurus sp.]|jgi:hypothetical protein|nr:hypothetical protein [Actinoallomurus sp.]